MTPDELRSALSGADPFVFGARPSGVTASDYTAVPVPTAAPATFTHPAVRHLPVKDQQGGTCVGNSISLCMEMLEYTENRRVIEFDGEELNGKVTHQGGAGAMPADVLDLVHKYGVEGQTDGVKGVYLPQAYAHLDHTNVEAVKAAMSTPGQVVTVAVWLQGNFGAGGGVDAGGHQNFAGTDYVHYDPNRSATPYHEITLVGYDDQGVTYQNSWGTWWGNHGFGKLAWDYLTSPRCGECWVITDSPDVAGGYVKTYTYDIAAPERAVKHKATASSTRPAVYLVKGNGRIWITDPFQARRFGVDLHKVELLDDTDPVWALPLIGPDAPVDPR